MLRNSVPIIQEDFTPVPHPRSPVAWAAVYSSGICENTGLSRRPAPGQGAGLTHSLCGPIFTQINGSFLPGHIHFCHLGHTLSYSPPRRAPAYSILCPDRTMHKHLESSEANITFLGSMKTGEQKDLLSKLPVSVPP